MRIGVMTFWWSEDNYGQLLQCYALQKYLRDLGHDAFLIRYRMPDSVPFDLKQKLLKFGLHPWLVFDGLRRVFVRRKGRAELAAHPRQFSTFRQRYLKVSDDVYHTIDDIRKSPPPASVYIVGSDQVWQFGESFRHDDILAMLLDFGTDAVKRVSYAASFGWSDFSRMEKREMTRCLKRFQAISVREKSGLEACWSVGYDSAKLVCDPTILLSAEDYLEMAEKPGHERKYVFCYMLTNKCDFKYPKLKAWADMKGLDIVYVPGNTLGDSSYDDGSAVREFLTIPQWLGCLASAEYVVTNSFHCCVFAAHFNRKIGVVPLKGMSAGLNARLEALDRILVSDLPQIIGNQFSILEGASAAQFVLGANASGRDFLDSVLSREAHHE